MQSFVGSRLGRNKIQLQHVGMFKIDINTKNASSKLSYNPEEIRLSSLTDPETIIYKTGCFGDILTLYIGFTDKPDFYTSFDWGEINLSGSFDKDTAFVNFYHSFSDRNENRYNY